MFFSSDRSDLRHNVFDKELFRRFRGDGTDIVIDLDTDAALTLSRAKNPAKFDFIPDIVFLYHIPEQVNDLLRPFNVT